ncbi:hypothetical protein ABMA28_012111 [Loxostege sticticalis]|uniref:Uncharacterized protein n=1 Tax=Loxostege sticticalis TaxID=481309 RepID=A0ABD0TLY2_LOXSC
MTSSADISELVSNRGIIKAKLTRFYNKIKDVSSLSESDALKIQFQYETLKDLYSSFNDIQNKIEFTDVDHIEKHLDERDAFEGTYAEAEAQSCSSSADIQIQGLKLPTISLPCFDGSYDRRIEYRDTFASLVHDNPNLPAISKYHYLRNSLRGSASILLQSLEFSAKNYQVAWQLLNDRFHNERLLVHNHVKALFSIDKIAHESFRSIRQLLDSVTKNLAALKSLGEPVEHWDTLIIYLVTSKLRLNYVTTMGRASHQ